MATSANPVAPWQSETGAEAPRLSVLHVAAPAAVGGLERVVHALARGHHRMGHSVRVAAVVDPRTDAAPFVDPLEHAGVPVDLLSLPARAYLRERQLVRQLCLAHRPEIVHTHGFRPDVIDAGVARRLGIPTVTTEHGQSKMGGKTALYEWLQQRSFRQFDAVVAVSTAIVPTLVRVGVRGDRIHVIPNAWAQDVAFLDRAAARQILGLPEDAFVVGWVGRLIRAKGADVLLRALETLPAGSWLGVVIGDGPERGRVERLADALQLSQRVRFRGRVVEAARLLAAFDVFVLSSRSEGTPIALFEAMAAGVPVVATAVGGVPDVVSPSEAWVVPPENAHRMGDAIGAVQADRAGARERARRARDRLTMKFGLEPWLRSYERLYCTLRRQPVARA